MMHSTAPARDPLHRRLAPVIGALFLLVIVGGVALHGANGPSVRILYRGSQTPGHMAYRYRRLDGDAGTSLRASAGETVVLSYDVEVDRGALRLALEAPDGHVAWEQTLTRSERGRVEVPIDRSGSQRLVVHGSAARGAFALDWEVRSP